MKQQWPFRFADVADAVVWMETGDKSLTIPTHILRDGRFFENPDYTNAPFQVDFITTNEEKIPELHSDQIRP